MSKRKKQYGYAHTAAGMEFKVSRHIKTGAIVPSNWKIQAGYLSGAVLVTRRMANRRARKEEARRHYFAGVMAAS